MPARGSRRTGPDQPIAGATSKGRSNGVAMSNGAISAPGTRTGTVGVKATDSEIRQLRTRREFRWGLRPVGVAASTYSCGRGGGSIGRTCVAARWVRRLGRAGRAWSAGVGASPGVCRCRSRAGPPSLIGMLAAGADRGRSGPPLPGCSRPWPVRFPGAQLVVRRGASLRRPTKPRVPAGPLRHVTFLIVPSRGLLGRPARYDLLPLSYG